MIFRLGCSGRSTQSLCLMGGLRFVSAFLVFAFFPPDLLALRRGRKRHFYLKVPKETEFQGASQLRRERGVEITLSSCISKPSRIKTNILPLTRHRNGRLRQPPPSPPHLPPSIHDRKTHPRRPRLTKIV